MSEPVQSVVDRLSHEPRLVAECVHSIYLPGDEAIFADPRPALPDGIRAGLDRRGVDMLWSHQVEGLQAVREGKNVLITTPTASGKSLIFYLPTLELASFGEVGNSLFLFPLKALGQDQKQKFDAFAKDSGLGEVARCEVYDGDTPRDLRRKIKRDFPRVIITNPDMLHLGILGHWQSWAPFLRGLRWIVIDELHACRGIFGSHFHHVLQRLMRICRHEGASPRLIASSATAGNATESQSDLRVLHSSGFSTRERRVRDVTCCSTGRRRAPIQPLSAFSSSSCSRVSRRSSSPRRDG